MRVNVFLIPREELTVIDLHETVEEALQKINDNKMLSLPVVDGPKFQGVLSKGYLFEDYFNGKESKEQPFCLSRKQITVKNSKVNINCI